MLDPIALDTRTTGAYVRCDVDVKVDMAPERMLIGELSKRAGVTPRTVRYYEGLGLLSAAVREGSGFHRYGVEALERLNKIAALKRLGLDLEEIRAVIDLYFSDPVGVQAKRAVLAILERHLQETERKIGELAGFRAELQGNVTRFREWLESAES